MRYANIQAEQAKLNMNNKQFAEFLGISTPTLNSYINCGAITIKALKKMANKFNCTIDYLLVEFDDDGNPVAKSKETEVQNE